MAPTKTTKPKTAALIVSLVNNQLSASMEAPGDQEGSVHDSPPPSSNEIGGRRSGLAGPSTMIGVEAEQDGGEAEQQDGEAEQYGGVAEPTEGSADSSAEVPPTDVAATELSVTADEVVVPVRPHSTGLMGAPEEALRGDDGKDSSDSADEVYGTDEGPGVPVAVLIQMTEKRAVAPSSNDDSSYSSDDVDVELDDDASPGIPVGIEHAASPSEDEEDDEEGSHRIAEEKRSGEEVSSDDDEEEEDHEEEANGDDDEDPEEDDEDEVDDEQGAERSSASEDGDARAKRRRAVGLRSDSDDSSNSVRASPTANRSRRLKKRRVNEDTSGSSDDSEIETPVPASLATSVVPPKKNLMGRELRAAAAAAAGKIRDSWRQWGSATRRRVRLRRGESKSEEDDPNEPAFTIEILEKLVDKKVEKGVVYYRAKWLEYKGQPDEYTWEPVENLENQKEWMELVDLYVKKCATIEDPQKKPTFDAFVKNNAKAILLGDSVDMKCFFFAIEAARKVLNLKSFDIDALVSKLESEGWDLGRGVSKDSAIPLVNAMTDSGLMLDREVWKHNTHKSEFGAGPVGVCRSLLPDSQGVWMVATVDPRRVGHCWVLVVDEDGMMTVYDNGAKTEFSNLRFGEILWVRLCVPFVPPPKPTKKHPTRRGPRKAKNKRRQNPKKAVDAVKSRP